MDVLIRLLARFILVPLGYLAAVIVGACVILLGSWKFAEMLVSTNQEIFSFGVLGFAIAGPVMFFVLFSAMWLPGAIGVVISEAFAIRSWIFHALNGVRIVLVDFWSKGAKYQRQMLWAVVAIWVVVFAAATARLLFLLFEHL